MTWQRAAVDATGSDLSTGVTVLLVVLGVLALVAVCGFGVLARLRDREATRRSLEALRAERDATAGENT